MSSSEPGALHPFTLAFPDAQLEGRFDAQYRQGALRYYRMLSLALLGFFAIISVTGLVVEFSVNREGIQRLLWYAMIPLTAIAAAALHWPPASRHARHVVVAYLVAIAAVCILFPRVRGDAGFAETYGYSYTAFLLFLLFPFSRLAPARALALAALVIAAYAGIHGVWMGPAPPANHIPLLLGSAALGFAVSYLMERSVRQLFAAQAQVEEREQRLLSSEARLREEMQKSESLLLSVLPESIARRLKDEGRSIADGIVECTVLFSDLVGFTTLAQEMGPRALVQLLNRLFSEFDELCDAHGLEKIKTIGDAYMVAGGVPMYMENHASAVADMALAMRDCMDRFNRENGTELSVRIGMHSGPVVAGIIGTRKFSYDLWGDAVNTAARMESHGLPGKIQATEATALLLRRTHEVTERGAVEVKGKGTIRTYWVEGRK